MARCQGDKEDRQNLARRSVQQDADIDAYCSSKERGHRDPMVTVVSLDQFVDADVTLRPLNQTAVGFEKVLRASHVTRRSEHVLVCEGNDLGFADAARHE